jgi:SAM-dependent methyltransferase
VTEPLQSRQPTVSAEASPAQFVDDEASAQDAHMNRSDMDMDTRVPTIERFKWPKALPALPSRQQAIADEFMHHWHQVLPRRYGAIEKFNHNYPLRHLPVGKKWRTLELGAGIGTHLESEPLDRQEYHCIELRPDMADEIRRKYPSVVTVTGDCQQRIPYSDHYFDRVVVVHVLEHLPNLPAAIAEIDRVTKPEGLFAAVLPCDPGLAYELARKVSAERLFKAKYGIPYRWLARREHINSPKEILQEIRRRFDIFDMVYFPLVVPVVNLNLCIGVTARKPGSARSV